MALVLKKDETTGSPITTDDNKIVYFDDETNQDLPLDPVAMYDKIGNLGKENQTHRQAKQAIETKFSAFTDLEDPAEYRTRADQALEQVANFNDKDWMKAEKVEKLKTEMKTSYEDQLFTKDQVIKDIKEQHIGLLSVKDQHIRKLMVSNKFATSPYFAGEKPKSTLPADIGESYFGNHFKVEDVDGDLALRAYFGKEIINSRLNPGEPAGFDEALSIIIDAYPGKNNILSASGSGSGGQGGNGNNEGVDHDDLATLKAAHKLAIDEKRAQDAVNIKNKIFNLQQKLANQ